VVSEATYSPAWFSDRSGGASDSAGVIVPMLFELLEPERVVDVGCGRGEWVAVAQRLGAEAIGIDGPWVDPEALRIAPQHFLARDLSKPLALEQTFDLAICVEVAEHLEPEHSSQLIDTLVALAPAIAFSAAVPGQGGSGHVNERWQDEWAAMFEARGYVALDAIRARVWSNPLVRWFYAQNLLLYVDPERVGDLEVEAPSLPLRVVHPRLYESSRRRIPAPGYAFRHLRAAVSARLSRLR
jgi:SAM-dependent methyltransferase